MAKLLHPLVLIIVRRLNFKCLSSELPGGGGVFLAVISLPSYILLEVLCYYCHSPVTLCVFVRHQVNLSVLW